MALALDHVFICSEIGAPEADRLVEFGLTEGTSNRHPGQGTANRRFFFHNAMLELLWVHTPSEAQSEAITRTQLWERWSGRSEGCPFGIAWRPATERHAKPPFPAWDFRPPYLPDTLRIQVGEDASPLEPMWFYLDFARRPDSQPLARRQPLNHAIGFNELTEVVLASPRPEVWSSAGRAIVDAGLITVQEGPEHLLELVFDGHTQGRTEDFRPHLPILFHW